MKRCKAFIAVFTISLSVLISYTQAQDWVWAKSAGGSSNEDAHCIVRDTSGNIYVAGSFYSPTLILGKDTLTNAGDYDVFLVKYDKNGNAVWARSAGGNSYDYACSIIIDRKGNLYLTGAFSSSKIVFGSYTLNNKGLSDIFIVKYDADGNVIWAKNTGGEGNNATTNSAATDISGNIFITGYFYSSALIFETDTITDKGWQDVFLVKYDSAGKEVWAKSGGGSNNEWGISAATDIRGNVYVTGYFNSPVIIFGEDTLINTDNSGKTSDIFLVKYDADGKETWAKSGGGTNNEWGYGVATDTSGNVYLTGWFQSPLITFGNHKLTNSDNSSSTTDIFLIKFDAGGNVDWAKNAGGNANEWGISVNTDIYENAYVTGFFNSPSITFGKYKLNNTGKGDIFLAKYNSAGTVVWAKGAGGSSYEKGLSVVADSSDNVYITGWFQSPTISFGNYTLTNKDNSGNTYDIFVAKLNGQTGVNELRAENGELRIWPNPANSQIYISYQQSAAGSRKLFKYATVVIFDVFGNKVLETQINDWHRAGINVESLKDGMYFIEIQTGLFVETRKLIISQ